jgi:hypothetical protein
MKRSSSSGEQSRGPGKSKLSQFYSKRQKESIEDPSVELSHGSGTCLTQESKGSGTLSGSKAETNDDTASTSRSKSIQPNNLDLAFDKSSDNLLCLGPLLCSPDELLEYFSSYYKS